MFLIYNENETKKGGGFFNPNAVDASKHYLIHFENYLFLKFILNNSKITTEKMRASKEIEIAERKMAYWEKQALFNKEFVQQERERLQAQWKPDARN